MLFIILGITYAFIIFIVLFGDYEEKEREEWRKKWEKLFGREYYDK